MAHWKQMATCCQQKTKPIKPGDYNKQELAVKKSPLHTIAFTDSKGVNYANGKEVPFDFQTAAGYTPKKTVFVPSQETILVTFLQTNNQ